MSRWRELPAEAGDGAVSIEGLTGVRHDLSRPLRTSVGELAVVEGDRSTDGSLHSQGVYEPQESAIISTLLSPGMQVLDVGANIGYFSLLASNRVGPTGVIHAFEPEPLNFRILRKNLSANDCRNVEIWACALSDYTGTQPLYLSRSNLGRHSFAFRNVPATSAAVQVRTRTMDDFCDDVIEDGPLTLVKIDVEGAEGRVLRGAGRLLARENVTVWFELWPEGLSNSGSDPEELLRWLDGYGFHAGLYDDVRLTPVRLESVWRKLREHWRGVRYLLLDRSPERIVAAAEAVSLVDPLQRAA